MDEELQRYFAIEARELVEGLTQAALHVERTGSLTPEQRKHVLRLAHTLKGAARVVRESAIADTAHGIEDFVSSASDTIGPSFGSRLLGLVDTIAQALPANVQVPEPAPSVAGAPAADDAMPAVRVERSAVDGAIERTADISARCADLRRDLESVISELPAAVRHAVTALDSVATAVSELRSQLYQLRLAPASMLFVALERAVRDAAQAGGVQARFVASGGEHRLDTDVLLALRDALIQLVRNAVAHGIEPPAGRATAGKPSEGIVSLHVERRGADLAFIVSDDGRGLDLQALRRAVRRAGGDEQALLDGGMAEAAIIERLLEGGLTSRESVSQLSGRGIGLDLVRAVVARYGGHTAVRNTPGRGLAIELVLPVSARSLSYLRVESAGDAALLPLDAVHGTMRLAGSAMMEIDGRQHLLAGGRPLPLVALDALFATADGDSRGGEQQVAALVEAEGALIAVAAERFGEASIAIAQALPPLSAVSRTVRAIALDDDGRVLPVLEPVELLKVAMRAAVARPRRERRVPRLLVVDDSITTRMLEQSILESAGFVVETAASAEEALERAAAASYDLFIVDVEMPGMNGFEFVAATRADAALERTPAILVTSRSAEADRRRGLDAGARAYIVKGEFDQDVFLNTVRGLVG
jgi:two-component system chemotaxis sensor kinase CheA